MLSVLYLINFKFNSIILKFFKRYKSENPSKDFRKAVGALSVYFDERAMVLSVIVIEKLFWIEILFKC